MPEFITSLSAFVEVLKNCASGIAEISLDLDNKTYSYSCAAPTEEAGVTAVSWTVGNKQKTSFIDSIESRSFIEATAQAIAELKELSRSQIHLSASIYLTFQAPQLFQKPKGKPINFFVLNMEEQEITEDFFTLNQMKKMPFEGEFAQSHTALVQQVEDFLQQSSSSRAVMLLFEGYQTAHSELIVDPKEDESIVVLLQNLITQDEITMLLQV